MDNLCIFRLSVLLIDLVINLIVYVCSGTFYSCLFGGLPQPKSHEPSLFLQRLFLKCDFNPNLNTLLTLGLTLSLTYEQKANVCFKHFCDYNPY